MNTRLIIISIVLLIYLLSEYYIYSNLKVIVKGSKWSNFYWGAFALSIVFVVVSVALAIYQVSNRDASAVTARTPLSNFLIGFTFSLLLCKLILAALFLVADISRFLFWGTDKIANSFDGFNKNLSLEGRRPFLIKLGLAVSAIPFVSFLYGITKGKYNYTVKKTTLTFNNLPPEFDGYRIVQISDIHSGSFDSVEEVAKGVALANEQNPDLILFTGDLVNDLAIEIDPYIETFKGLKAKDGVYSVTGNHDYGDYFPWETEEAKAENFKTLIAKHDELNFKILQNKSVKITKGSAHFNLLGVDNWGLPPFPQKGDLTKALEGVDDSFTLLMSHDPSHWDAEVKKSSNKVDLTLSGHTHGMQFGIDIPGFKWSPVKYKYPKWAGLYEENNTYLYVNRGYGFLGLPGRVGIWPEITLIELKSGSVG